MNNFAFGCLVGVMSESEDSVFESSDVEEDVVETSSGVATSGVDQVDFLTEIPAEKKYLLELKWNVYIGAKEGDVMDWVAVLVDNKGKVMEMRCDKTSSYVTDMPMGLTAAQVQMRGEICSVLGAVGHLLDMYDDKTKTYLDVNVITESIYLYNLWTDYIHIWATELFANRPNGDVIAQLHMMMNIMGKNLTIDWVPLYTCEHIKRCHETLKTI